MSINNNKRETKIQVKRAEYKPEDYDWVKVRYEGDSYVTVVGQEKPTKAHIKKLSKTKYEVLKTGEIKEYKVMTDKEKMTVRKSVLKRTFGDLTGILRANFSNTGEKGWLSQLFITLTYAENMTDEKRLYVDFKKFMMSLKYRFKGVYDNLEYVVVAEPQGRGAWHMHIMLKDTKVKKLWIDKEIINELWPHGYSQTERLKSKDVGLYYTAYFSGLLVGASNDGTEEDATGEEILEYEQGIIDLSKKVIKGQRLKMYPKNFKFYRCSRGIVRPKKEVGMIEWLENEGYEEIYSKSFGIERTSYEDDIEKREFVNKIYKGTYKKTSKKKTQP